MDILFGFNLSKWVWRMIFQIALRGGGIRNFAGGLFYRLVGTWGEVILTIRTFSKRKATFCEHWTPIKIKISMTYVYKEYEVKIKMIQEQWLQLKITFLLDYSMKIVI